MRPAQKNLTLWRGNTTDLKFRLKQDEDTPFDLTGSEIVISILHGGGQEDMSSTGAGVIIAAPETGEFTVPVSVGLSRALKPRYGGIHYEIERRIDGAHTTILYGTITMQGGANAD